MSSYKLKKILFKIYNLLPERARRLILPIIEPFFLFAKRLLLIISQIQLSVTLFDGKEKLSGSNIKTLFFGGERIVPYIINHLYSKEPKKEILGKVFIWNTKSILQSDIAKPDIIFIGVDEFLLKFLSKNRFIVIPEWVLFTLDLSKPLLEVFKLSKNKSLGDDLRKVRKYEYHYKITHKQSEFEYFYYQMYLPYIPKRFRKLTIPTSFQHMKMIFDKGYLIMIKQGDEDISGMIVWTNNEKVFASYLGIREGRMEYLKKGALSAAYYFTILWAKEKGYKQLDLAHSRSFLNDGLFIYKKKWNTTIKRSKRLRGVLGMKIINPNQEVLNFLEENPFLFIYQNKLNGLIISNRQHPLTINEVQSLFKNYYIPGISYTVIISPHGFTQKAINFASSNPYLKLDLINMDKDIFFKKFPNILNKNTHKFSINENDSEST